MISVTGTASTTIASPTETLPAEPSSLRVVDPILTSVGLISEIHKYGDSDLGGPADEPHAAKLDKRWEELRQAAFESAVQLAEEHASSPTALARMAQAAHNAGQRKSAAESAIKALELLSQSVNRGISVDAPALYAAAGVLAAVGQASTAEEWLERLPRVPSTVVFLAALAVERRDYSRALNMICDTPSSTAGSLRAWLLLREGKAQAALRELRSVHRVAAPTPETLSNAAYAYAVLGSPTKAARTARQAVVLAPMDESASFNLVGYYLTLQLHAEAQRELDRLARTRGEDADIALARAGVHWDADDLDAALGVLLRARATIGLPASVRASSEISANIVMLRYYRGELNRTQARKEIRAVASRAAGRSTGIVMAYLSLLSSTSQIRDAEALVEQAREWHSTEKLLQVEARVAHWKCDFRRELALSTAWAQESPLNEFAVGGRVYLEGAVEGRYSEAADRGIDCLKRLPSSPVVLNNTAYCLAMAGRANEAREIIYKMGEDRHVPVATAGLVAMSLGKLKYGALMYRRAAEMARSELASEDYKRVQAILAINQRIILEKIGCTGFGRGTDILLPLDLPRNWETQPSIVLCALAAEREGVAVTK